MSILDGFKEITNRSTRNRNDGLTLKIGYKQFIFSYSACKVLRCERLKIKYNEATRVIALIPSKETGVRVNPTSSTIISNSNLFEVVDKFLNLRSKNGLHHKCNVNGQYITNGDEQAVFFDLNKAEQIY